MSKLNLVVVGLGMVGLDFVEKMLERDLIQKQYKITVIGEENYLAYNRVGLTEFFQKRNVDDLLLAHKDWYSNIDTNRLTYRINEPVININREAKTVDTATHTGIPYDVLVLATGSSAFYPKQAIPPSIKNMNDSGVFVYRTIDDVRNIIHYSDDLKNKDVATRRAVVVGGGLLGIEAASAMQELKSFDKIGIVDRCSWLLAMQLDEAGGNMLTRKISSLGVDIKVANEITKLNFDSENRLESVVFKDGSVEECQLLVFAIGIRARDDLAAKAGLEVSTTRGGIIVNDKLQTSDPNIYAIGECSNWHNKVFGLIAPGKEMSDVVSFNLTQAKLHQEKLFTEPNLGTRLKLMGVDVASFGDYFADKTGPKSLPNKKKDLTPDDVQALVYEDPFQDIYKKLIFSKDGKYLVGGILVGNISEYLKFNSLVNGQKELEKSPAEYVYGAANDEDDDPNALDDSTQICSCNNVSKGDLVKVIKDGTCKTLAELKTTTKAATACGGCEGSVKAILQATLKDMGEEVSSGLCIHFKQTRADLFHIIMVKQLDTFEKVMNELSCMPGTNGCEICKPTIGSILSSLYNRFVMDKKFRGLQETNDRFLGNIQRNGTYSVVPRVSGGEITPEKLIALGEVARKFNLYTKLTGGQRVDLFGAQKSDLPEIWEILGKAGFETGHAYGKSLRTVKSCVGTTWCRYGLGDSVGMAIRLEERYKSLRSPHKIKGGVSGCIRDCAEFHNKDFGLCSVVNGYNVFVGGNGGMKPTHAILLAKDVLPDQVIPLLDRYLMFYIRTADKLQRTARWLENLPGGIEYLREVIIDDKLGICAELEKQMQDIVSSFHDEWAEAIKDPETRKDFRQFVNTPRRIENVEIVYERGQAHPADWIEHDTADLDMGKHVWKSPMEWVSVCDASELPAVGASSSSTVLIGDSQLAVFRTGEGKLMASQNMCPHKRAFVLSQGIVGSDEQDRAYVSCPLHKRNFILDKEDDGGSCKNDTSMSILTFDIKEEDGKIWLYLPSVDELDSVLATSKWKVKQEHSNPRFDALDARYPMKLPERVPSPVLIDDDSKLDW